MFAKSSIKFKIYFYSFANTYISIIFDYITGLIIAMSKKMIQKYIKRKESISIKSHQSFIDFFNQIIKVFNI